VKGQFVFIKVKSYAVRHHDALIKQKNITHRVPNLDKLTLRVDNMVVFVDFHVDSLDLFFFVF
jgi:hypothetical protein